MTILQRHTRTPSSIPFRLEGSSGSHREGGGVQARLHWSSGGDRFADVTGGPRAANQDQIAYQGRSEESRGRKQTTTRTSVTFSLIPRSSAEIQGERRKHSPQAQESLFQEMSGTRRTETSGSSHRSSGKIALGTHEPWAVVLASRLFRSRDPFPSLHISSNIESALASQ